jgi:hypothetical protein
MEQLLFPPELQAILGIGGMSFALWSIQRRREGKPMHPDAAKSDRWLLVFSVIMVAVGVWRWYAAWSSTISAVAPT